LGVDFEKTNPYGDPFCYEGWAGHLNLVKFNLKNPEVRAHLLDAVILWIDRYDLDGLRLDAADVVDPDFLRELSAFCKARKPDFWLMGEVIHGDYRAWAPGAGLDAVTNYELFKGLWSSLNDGNYFEAAWTLNRQFGPEGIYRGQRFYNFGDNHDVNRLASTLVDPAYLYPHAILTATAPGQPSVYYGSEAGEVGIKSPHGDELLRPARTPNDLDKLSHQPLRDLWSRLAEVRRREPALKSGTYHQATVAARQFSFWRIPDGPHRPVLVVLNSQAAEVPFAVELPQGVSSGSWIDLLNPSDRLEAHQGQLRGQVSPCWGRILVPA
jgi:glycosidase